jgi:hypothetical protein
MVQKLLCGLYSKKKTTKSTTNTKLVFPFPMPGTSCALGVLSGSNTYSRFQK